MDSSRDDAKLSPSNGHLRRGGACTNCRRRKIRCDGVRPTCGPCARSTGSFSDCEYAASGRPRTQILEENIAHLEARIQEIENPGRVEGSVALQHPYSGATQEASASPLEVSLSPVSGTELPGSPSYLTDNLGSTPSSDPSANVRGLDQEEPHASLVQALIHNFFHYAGEIGFFLDHQRFQDAAVLPLPIGHHSRPAPCLLTTIYLWGIHFSGNPAFDEYEALYVARALDQTAHAISSLHPQKVMHAIQAEILLAYYFFHKGRILEGKYHTSVATSLVISTRLHKIRSDAQEQVQHLTISGVAEPLLPIPGGVIEEGERISAFWTVVVLNNCWSVILNSPSNISYDQLSMQADVPWPFDSYDESSFSSDMRSSLTVKRFLEGEDDDNRSLQALFAKVALLLERAYVMKRRLSGLEIQAESFTAGASSLENLINKFQLSLPDINQVPEDSLKNIVVIHCLAYTVEIILSSSLTGIQPDYPKKSIEVASQVVGLVDIVGTEHASFVNPILGGLWMMSAQVFIDELARMRAVLDPPAQDLEYMTMLKSLNKIAKTMSTLATKSQFMANQLSRIQAALNVA